MTGPEQEEETLVKRRRSGSVPFMHLLGFSFRQICQFYEGRGQAGSRLSRTS